ncbi:RagB/SusD family nutrient uptake outer membrane protein [Pontibacter silvestris]|uniref:RagB/SusD family nutrient uptake outer membrane protein n=1 Tax=Pontibacter silvestris TaxID=2305183 RepID=A0ABW4WZI7_9BACT|nr:RagB/SusD family nutrient uptake outer membrane protein [Pontibacter silvestris]MCC9137605.1 RagB/SusD family nutrient uptake outer membrane protein [Pontibacter silvestris]
MKFIKHIVPILALAFASQACEDFLDKEPLGVETDRTFYEDPENAVLAVNGIYDAISWDAGGVTGSSNTFEWMYGDVLSDDAKKGSTTGDFIEIKQMERWGTLTNSPITSSTWNNMFTAIYRANQVLSYLPASSINEELKTRLLGEAYFLRGYSYFNLVTKFGGLPLMEEPLPISEWGQLERASIADTYAFIQNDLQQAIEMLPQRGEYAGSDLGRATQGAARAYLARAYMYQLGTDNANGVTWQDVYDQTNAIITSGQYSLFSNYAGLFEIENENNVESIFEIQFSDVATGWGPPKTGTVNNVIQNNRSTWGWGFNNPTQDLVSEFEGRDPRLPVTVYSDGDIVAGELQVIDYPGQNETGYLNRKAFVEPSARPSDTQNSPKNIIKFRYADVLLMQAEAAYHLGNESEAQSLVNQVRQRARNSTRPKGSTAEGATGYVPYENLSGVLPDITASGQDLLEAIWHERRVELGMESLRYYDLVRTGRYFDALEEKYSDEVRVEAEERSISGSVNPMPVLPIPINEAQAWGITQNPGY